MPPAKKAAKKPAKKATAKAAAKQEPCTWHPPNRRIGNVCMQCGFEVAAKK